jgi:hypothetical protein
VGSFVLVVLGPALVLVVVGMFVSVLVLAREVVLGIVVEVPPSESGLPKQPLAAVHRKSKKLKTMLVLVWILWVTPAALTA